MRLLHTADWHLGARIEGIDRWEDQLARLREIFDHAERERVDCLIVAGDVFDESRGPHLQRVVRDLGSLMKPLVEQGMSAVFLAGNHDREYVFPLFQVVQDLVSADQRQRVVFCEKPELVTVPSRDGGEAIDLMMLPYPTANRYDLPEGSFGDAPGKRRLLADAVRERAREMGEDLAAQQNGRQVVVVGHFLIRGSKSSSNYELAETEDVTVEVGDLPAYPYVALGHIHQAQHVRSPHIRYSGSLDRIDFGEEREDKGAVLVEIGSEGMVGEPAILPLTPTPMVSLEAEATDDLELLARERVPDPEHTIVRLKLKLRQDDNFAALQAKARSVFPRLRPIQRQWIDQEPFVEIAFSGNRQDVRGTVRGYLDKQLKDSADRDRLLEMAEEILAEAGR